MGPSAAAPSERLNELTTAHVADACVRLRVPVRCGPYTLRPAAPGTRASGRVRPVRHFGSVDVFLEALEQTPPGSILVVDNEGRLDEACVGDLVALEAKGASLGGIVIWGLHRDSREIAEIGLPLFSMGALPTGPLRLDARAPDAFEWARVGLHVVTADDVVMADADGVLFVPASRLDDIVAAAAAIRQTEHRQAEAMRAGRSLRAQLSFREYLARRATDANYGLRQHLREINAAIEE